MIRRKKVSVFSGYRRSSGIAGSYSRSAFSHLRNLPPSCSSRLPRWYGICLPVQETTGHPASVPGLGRSPGRKRQPTGVLLPGESHGQRSPRGWKESDTTEVMQTHISGASVCIPISPRIPPFPCPLGVHTFLLYTYASSTALQMVLKLLWPSPLLTNFHALVFFLACSLTSDFH